MDEISTSLHDLVGRHLVYEGVACQVIDVVTDGPFVVLSRTGADGVIQPNQFGEARRRVPQTYMIPLWSQVRDDLHPVLRELLSDDECDALSALARLTRAQ
ncbi:MAG TPA: hypothetical protein ENN42_00570 [Thioalkalivibrio sp.]|nr:hypothetical protein [Thioalkalivibrio sp.]